MREFDLLDAMEILGRKWVAILAATLGAGLLAFCVCTFALAPRYEASVNMIVNARSQQTGYMTSDDLTASENLVDTYAVILRGNRVLNRVIGDLELPITYEELLEKVTVEAVNGTQVMKLAVRDQDPEQALRILEGWALVAPEILRDAVDAGSCKTVSDAAVDPEPVFPETGKITLIAAFLGLVVSMAAVLVRELSRDALTRCDSGTNVKSCGKYDYQQNAGEKHGIQRGDPAL